MCSVRPNNIVENKFVWQLFITEINFSSNNQTFSSVFFFTFLLLLTNYIVATHYYNGLLNESCYIFFSMLLSLQYVCLDD